MSGLVATVENGDEVVYYGGFSGYQLPLKPEEKLSKDTALSRKTYCMGYQDGGGRLYRFEKYLNGKLFFRHDYSYHADGTIKKSMTTNADGELRVLLFDETGDPLKISLKTADLGTAQARAVHVALEHIRDHDSAEWEKLESHDPFVLDLGEPWGVSFMPSSKFATGGVPEFRIEKESYRIIHMGRAQ